MALDDHLQVSLDICNAGKYAGHEVVQLYIQDLVASVTSPVKELKGFQKIYLCPGERRSISFSIPVSTLGFHDDKMAYIVEPGTFRLWIGADSTEGLSMDFEVIGT